jgi:hypothetical protein
MKSNKEKLAEQLEAMLLNEPLSDVAFALAATLRRAIDGIDDAKFRDHVRMNATAMVGATGLYAPSVGDVAGSA